MQPAALFLLALLSAVGLISLAEMFMDYLLRLRFRPVLDCGLLQAETAEETLRAALRLAFRERLLLRAVCADAEAEHVAGLLYERWPQYFESCPRRGPADETADR